MCSWCWGFRRVWQALITQLDNDITLYYLAGGLAPDSDQAMPEDLQTKLQQVWRTIEDTIPGTVFNYDFWNHNTPRRSTYPACRAVVAVGLLEPSLVAAMATRIAEYYYLHARNPSDISTLTDCAVSLGICEQVFGERFNAVDTQQWFEQHLILTRKLQHCDLAQGFPSLVYVKDPMDTGSYTAIPLNYLDCAPMKEAIDACRYSES